jgi:outer membrane protein TolC
MGKRLFIALAGLVLLSACSGKYYRRSADREVARLIAEKTPLVPNMDTNFTIEASARVSLDGLPVYDRPEEAFGPDADIERGSKMLSLEKAMEMATQHSRNYQNRKEGLYLQALSLSLGRHEYTPIFSARPRARYQKSRTEIENGITSVVEHRETVSVGSEAGVDLLLRTGTRLAAAFSTDFLRFLSGGPQTAVSSEIVGSITQPLLQGAGYRIATENLTQAERDLLYELRDFTRFRKQFTVDTASAYYGVLQNRDAVRNSWRGLQSFKLNAARERAFYEEGQRSTAQLDQIRQAELSTESSWINAVRVYRQNLDEFKVQIGLPADAQVVLDDSELQQLKVVHPVVNADDAVKVALVSRLDLQTQRDQLEDAGRKVYVARNTLLPKVDLAARGSLDSQPGNGFRTPDFQRYSWSAGLELDLPIDRKRQRNGYRASLISFERARRQLDLAVDTIKLEISQDWRALDQAKRSYEISELGVQIAERRVKEQQLRQELGLGNARDLVDAQNDLIASKNQRTSALVSHTIARLRFWRDMGILYITDNGQWENMSDADVHQDN